MFQHGSWCFPPSDHLSAFVIWEHSVKRALWGHPRHRRSSKILRSEAGGDCWPHTTHRWSFRSSFVIPRCQSISIHFILLCQVWPALRPIQSRKKQMHRETTAESMCHRCGTQRVEQRAPVRDTTGSAQQCCNLVKGLNWPEKGQDMSGFRNDFAFQSFHVEPKVGTLMNWALSIKGTPDVRQIRCPSMQFKTELDNYIISNYNELYMYATYVAVVSTMKLLEALASPVFPDVYCICLHHPSPSFCTFLLTRVSFAWKAVPPCLYLCEGWGTWLPPALLKVDLALVKAQTKHTMLIQFDPCCSYIAYPTCLHMSTRRGACPAALASLSQLRTPEMISTPQSWPPNLQISMDLSAQIGTDRYSMVQYLHLIEFLSLHPSERPQWCRPRENN